MTSGQDGELQIIIMVGHTVLILLVLSAEQQTAFNDYLRSGGAYMGIHSASDCLQNTAFYNQTVGAIFDYHPPIQDAVSLFLKAPMKMTDDADVHASNERPSINGRLS
jgi:hypothetical protein